MSAGYIGGELSYGERETRYLGILRALPVEHGHWPFQCRCGELGFVRYRGRSYCPSCGYRWNAKGLANLVAASTAFDPTEEER